MTLLMDDFGACRRTHLPSRRSRAPDEEQIRGRILAPLRRHQAVLMRSLLTGLAGRRALRAVDPWTVRGAAGLERTTFHDCVRAGRGLEHGLCLGLSGIERHDYPRVPPNLERPPGPFRDAPFGSVDHEFRDALPDPRGSRNDAEAPVCPLAPGSPARLPDDLGDRVRDMSANECKAYPHARVRANPSEPATLPPDYGEHCSRCFARHSSNRTSPVAGRLRGAGRFEKRLPEAAAGPRSRPVRRRSQVGSANGC